MVERHIEKLLLEKFQEELESAQSITEISNIFQKRGNGRVNFPESVDYTQVKTDISKSLAENQNKLKAQAANWRSKKTLTILKQFTKLNLEALISGLILLFVWQHTLWARIKI